MTKYSVKKPYTVLVGVILVFVLGIVSFLGLKTDLLPTMDLPYVVVYTVYPGASPERVETAVTQIVEGAVATTSGLENMSSISRENVSLIILEFNQSSNMDSVLLELSTNIDTVSGYFDDMVQKPVMMKINPNMLPVQMMSVDADGKDIKELTEYIETTFSPRIERIDGVATVDVSGSVQDRVDIFLNEDKIEAINDKLLKSIDSSLYDAKVELNKAKKELEDAENNLKSQEKSTYNQLAEASVRLDDGLAQLNAITGEKTQLDAQEKLLASALLALDSYHMLKGFQSSLPAATPLLPMIGLSPDTATMTDLINAPTTLRSVIASLTAEKTALERRKTELDAKVLALTITPEEQDELDGIPRKLTELTTKIATLSSPAVSTSLGALSAGVPALIAAKLVTETTTFNQLVATINAQVTAAEGLFTQLGLTVTFDPLFLRGINPDPNTAARTKLTEDTATVKNEISRVSVLASQLEGTIKSLKEQRKMLESGKMQAASGMAVGNVTIANLKEKVESGQKEFENARDSALKQANINSLVTRSMLSNILVAQNFSMPAGYLNDDGARFTVKVGEDFSEIEQIRNLLLVDMHVDGMDPIYLSDVADVEINDNSKDSYVRVNGNPAVMLSISKSSTASTAEVSDLIEKECAEIMAENPDVHVTTLMDQGMYIDMIVSSVLKNLRFGGVLAIIVLLLFLKDLKPTVIIAFSIPISLLFAIVLMYFSNVTLNIMSLSGLALGVGMLVDNSVVVIENTYRLRNLGYSRVQSAVVGARQVAGAITASTLTTICVFLPIVFTDGISRQLFTDMGLTIAYSLVASLIVALTLVPAMSSKMLNTTKSDEGTLFGRIVEKYVKLLNWNLDHKIVFLGLAVGLLVFSGWSATKMPMTLIPSMDSTQMTMTYTLPAADYTEDDLIADSEQIAQVVRDIEGVDTVGILMGSSGISGLMGSSSSNNLSMTFYIVLDEHKSLSNSEITEIIKEKTPEYAEHLSISASTMDVSALTGSGISIVVKGYDLDILQKTATEIGEIAKNVEGVKRVSDGSANEAEEVRIDVNKTEAMKHGLTVAQVYQKISGALTETTTATTVTLGGTDMKAIIHAATTYDRQGIENLVVATETDKKDSKKEKDILLKDIATIHMAESPKAINRDNGSRYKTVTIRLEDGYNTTLVAREVESALKDYKAPKGYTFEMSGENETTMSAMYDMFKMIGLAIIFIYLIMVAQFQSLKSPFIVIFTIPLAFTGGLLSLLISGKVLSVVAMIGFLVLSGVVVNNGIVFVDYINQLRLDGIDKRAAILQTGHDRIKPVLMTALTTILANAVMAVGVGMGAEMTQGMAIVTMGGLAYATLLTLFVVPDLYDIFNKKDMKKIEVDFEDENI